MPRAPFQVLVIPFRRTDDGFKYALFRRCDGGYWQGIAGGGEDDESPLDAVRREAREEAGLDPDSRLIRLDTTSTVPVTCFADSHLWGDDLYVVPEHCFGLDATGRTIRLSDEHTEFRWFPAPDAMAAAQYDSNRTAIWELNQRLLGRGPRG